MGRAIEWFWQLAHGCWSPLPTNRIVCDTGSDDLLGRICHPFCSVSMTPNKARLIGFYYKWKIQSIATERYSRDSLYSAVSHSAIYPFLRWLKSQVYHLLYSALKYKWKIQSIATERYSRDSLYSAVSHSAIYPFLRWLKSQVYHLLYSALKCFQVTHYFVLR